MGKCAWKPWHHKGPIIDATSKSAAYTLSLGDILGIASPQRGLTLKPPKNSGRGITPATTRRRTPCFFLLPERHTAELESDVSGSKAFHFSYSTSVVRHYETIILIMFMLPTVESASSSRQMGREFLERKYQLLEAHSTKLGDETQSMPLRNYGHRYHVNPGDECGSHLL